MPDGHVSLPDWRDAASYADLLQAALHDLAWEWLRRDPGYRAAAGLRGRPAGSSAAALPADPAANAWGLHDFADPALPSAGARPIWRRGHVAGVLAVSARAGGARHDMFDLARFADLATVVRGADGAEHVLLSNASASLRLDVVTGSLLAGPALLSCALSGFAGLSHQLATLHGLLRLHTSGRLPRQPAPTGNTRRVLLLRAWDGLQAGASQRELAASLLSGEARQARWRTETPSLRLRAQRLAGGARAMARGGYLALASA